MYEALINNLRRYAKQYRCGETLGRAIVDTEDIMDDAANSILELLKEKARKAGWVRRKNGDSWEDYCPECQRRGGKRGADGEV